MTFSGSCVPFHFLLRVSLSTRTRIPFYNQNNGWDTSIHRPILPNCAVLMHDNSSIGKLKEGKDMEQANPKLWWNHSSSYGTTEGTTSTTRPPTTMNYFLECSRLTVTLFQYFKLDAKWNHQQISIYRSHVEKELEIDQQHKPQKLRALMKGRTSCITDQVSASSCRNF